MPVGLVGLGRMGSAMASRLAAQGHPLLVWDHDPKKCQAARNAGHRLAGCAAEVAESAEIIVSMITEDSGARHLYTGPGGYMEAGIAGKLFIEMSTLQPGTVRELASLLNARGAAMIDSPVLGSVPRVVDGKLFALVGGEAADVARARVIHDALTRRVAHLGPVGSGAAMKLAVNLGMGAYLQALAESLALGQTQGLTLDQMLDVLSEAPTACGFLASKLEALKSEAEEITLDLRTLRKDVLSALATGALSGVPMPLTAGTATSLSAAVANGWGGKDLAELPRFFREAMPQKYWYS